MSLAITCPACGRTLRARAEIAGKRVRCPGCSTTFEAPPRPESDFAELAEGEAQERAQVAPRSATPLTQRGGAPATPTPPAAAPVRQPRAMRPWSAWDHLLFRTGIGCILCGLLAVVLPAFGLQVRKLQHLGAAATTAGWGLAATGGAMIVYVLFLRGRLLRVTLIAGAVALVAFCGLVAWAVFAGSQRLPLRPNAPTTAWRPPTPPQFPAATTPPIPGQGPPRPPPAQRYEDYCDRYGAARVVRVRLTGIQGLDVHAALKERAPRLLPADGARGWSAHASGDTVEVIAAPVTDLTSVAAVLDLGAVESTDTAGRLITIHADRGKFQPLDRDANR